MKKFLILSLAFLCFGFAGFQFASLSTNPLKSKFWTFEKSI